MSLDVDAFILVGRRLSEMPAGIPDDLESVEELGLELIFIYDTSNRELIFIGYPIVETLPWTAKEINISKLMPDIFEKTAEFWELFAHKIKPKVYLIPRQW